MCNGILIAQSDFSRLTERCGDLSINVAKLYLHMCDDNVAPHLSKLLLSSGTAIGAYVDEGMRAWLPDTFERKLSAALGEALKCEHWLSILMNEESASDLPAAIVLRDCRELCELLCALLKETADKSGKEALLP